MSELPEGKVAIRPSGSQTPYHSDEDCRKLQQITRVAHIDADLADDWYDECEYCAGEHNVQGQDDRSYYEAALAAGQEADT